MLLKCISRFSSFFYFDLLRVDIFRLPIGTIASSYNYSVIFFRSWYPHWQTAGSVWHLWDSTVADIIISQGYNSDSYFRRTKVEHIRCPGSVCHWVAFLVPCYFSYTPLKSVPSPIDTVSVHTRMRDDAQLHIHRKADDLKSSIPQLVSCIDEMKCWMSANRLKLNTDSFYWEPDSSLSKWTVNSYPLMSWMYRSQMMSPAWVECSTMNWSFSAHVKRLTRKCFQHLRQMHSMRPSLSVDAVKTLVSSFIQFVLIIATAFSVGSICSKKMYLTNTLF